MKIRIALLSAACALALSACGEAEQPATPAATPPAATSDAAPAATTPATTTPAQPAPATTPPPAAGETAQAPAAAAPAAAGTSAAVTDCGTEIESNDAMQFSVKSIVIPSSCTDFTITMKHVGKMPVAAMGHNVVITTQADMAAVLADGMAAGLDAGYVKPDDARVIAHTDMIGGGETTQVTFAVSKLADGGPFKFFCSFPGHAALMNGSVSVE